MRKQLVTPKAIMTAIQKVIANILRRTKRNIVITVGEDDNFNHLLFYSLDYEGFLPIFANKLMTEYNHAKNENLNVGKYFLVNMQRFSEYLKLDKQVIISVLYYMEERGLVSYAVSGIENTKLLCLDEEKLIKYFPECKYEESKFFEHLRNNKLMNSGNKFFDYLIKYEYKKPKTIYLWDKKFESTYKSKKQILSFCDTANELWRFVDKNIKNPNKMPLATYSYCDDLFRFYRIPISHLADKNIREQILKCISIKDFKPTDLTELIEKLCNEYLDKNN